MGTGPLGWGHVNSGEVGSGDWRGGRRMRSCSMGMIIWHVNSGDVDSSDRWEEEEGDPVAQGLQSIMWMMESWVPVVGRGKKKVIW